MENDKRFEIISRALEHYGATRQIMKVCEEYSEATVAVLHHLDGKISREEVISEIADVEIMNKQMQILYGVDEVRKEIDRKLERLEKRMREGR